MLRLTTEEVALATRLRRLPQPCQMAAASPRIEPDVSELAVVTYGDPGGATKRSDDLGSGPRLDELGPHGPRHRDGTERRFDEGPSTDAREV